MKNANYKKLLEDNRKNLDDLSLVMTGYHSKGMIHERKKIDKLDYIKIKNFYSEKLSRELNYMPHMKEKTHLIKDTLSKDMYYPKYTKNS